nr:hypothetical protein [Bacteroides acidifaciens]
MFFFPSVRPVRDRRDYFSACERWRGQSAKAGRKNTLDKREEDFYGHSCGSRHWQDWNSRFTFAEKCNPPQVAQCEWSEWQLKQGDVKGVNGVYREVVEKVRLLYNRNMPSADRNKNPYRAETRYGFL